MGVGSPPQSSLSDNSCFHPDLSDIPQLDGNSSSLLCSSSLMSSERSSTLSKSLTSSSINATHNSLEESWFSQSPECNTSQTTKSENSIPVIVGYRPRNSLSNARQQPPVRIVIRRENKCVEALSLPVITS